MRRTAAVWALAALFSIAACKKDEPGDGASKPADEQAPKSGDVAKTADKTPPKAPAADSPPAPGGYAAAISKAFDDAGLKLGPPPLADWPPKSEWSEQSFYGWSADGSLYRVTETFGHDEVPGIGPFFIVFEQIRDSHTGKVVAMFRGDPFKSEDWGDDVGPVDANEKKILAIWKKLPKKKDGEAFLTKHGFQKKGVRPSRTGPNKATVSAAFKGKAPFGLRLAVKPVKAGFDTRWDRIRKEAGESKTYAPKLELTLDAAGAVHRFLSVRPKWEYEWLYEVAGEGRETTLTGEIRPYWDLTGRRVAVEVRENVEGQMDEYGDISRREFYIRAIGPQIKIIDSGVGADVARKAAALFDKGGLFVTTVEKAKKPSEGAMIYYRGDAGKAASEKAAKLVPGARIEELKKSGWVDVIVVLGS